MDSTEFNKIAGAGLGALLIFLLLNFFSGQIYGTREAGEHHGEEVLAFALAVETEGAGEAGEEPQVDLAALVAEADPAAGESTFRACSACHKVEEGANAVGPHLYGVVGRDIASVDGFSYSDALMAAEGDWTLTNLSGFLEDPKGWAPGTKMSYAGLDDPQDRVNVIAYLNEAGGSPIDLAEGLEPVAAAEPETATDAAEAPAGEPAAAQQEGGEETPTDTGPAEAEEGAGTPPVEGAAVEATDPETEVVDRTVVDMTEEDVDIETTPAEVAEESDAAPAEALPSTLQPGVMPKEGDSPAEPAEGAAPAQSEGAAEGAQQPGEDEQSAAPAQSGDQAAEDTQLAAAPAPAAQQAAAAAGGMDFSAGDAAAGEKVFRRCLACHKVEEGKHGVGPSLWGVVGRDIGAVEGYKYSDAMAAHDGTWTAEQLSAYLENPKAVVPGTKMAFAGLKDPQDRIDVITYLNEADGSPEPLQ